MTNKVIIIGGGPAGVACAIAIKHLGIEPLIIEKHKIGGLIRNANLVENYSLLEKNITGKMLAKKLEQKIKDRNIKVVYDEVKNIKTGKEISVKTSRKTYKTEYLVIATGTKASILPKIKIDKKTSQKIFYEIADIPKQNKKTIAIIGAGDVGFDYAINLSKNNEILILNKDSKPKCNLTLLKRVNENQNIAQLKNVKIKNISTQGKKIKIDTNKKPLITDTIIVAIGRKPNLDFVKKNILKNKKIFVIGDTVNDIYRQVSITSADGVKTAMHIFEDYESKTNNR